MEHLDKEMASGKHYDYVLVADFDGVNSKIRTREPLEKLLSKSRVICANQFGRYYDILALRKKDWVEEDYRLSARTGAKIKKDPLLAYLRNVSSKQGRILPSKPDINVESAFGGLTIYPTNAIAGLRYSPSLLPFDLYECEHVSFNRLARERGYEIVIVPGLQNSGSLQHTFLAHFPVKFLALVVGNMWGIIQNLRK
jgi:hypothetical protein